MNKEEKMPYYVENKERDTFTIYVKGTKPYLDLQQENKQLKERIDKAIEITNLLLMNSADNRMIANEEEKDYFNWLDRTLMKQLEILKGE